MFSRRESKAETYFRDATPEDQTQKTPPNQNRLGGFLDLVLSATHTEDSRGGSNVLDRFLAEPDDLKSLSILFGNLQGLTKAEILTSLNVCIADIDQLVGKQIDSVLHHEDFQALESAWRGIVYLIEQKERSASDNIQIRMLDASWKELDGDIGDATEFDQSHLFKLVYENEFGMAGGTPYGVLIGNYALRPHPQDYFLIEQIAGIAAASFCPFITSVSPEFFGTEDFSDLESVRDLGAIFEQPEYIPWRSFRESEDARYVGLALPRVLMRQPYQDDGSREYGFRYRENVDGRTKRKYLWGNAAFAFGEVLIRAFGESSWLANIRGVHRNEESGGIVTGLPVTSFGTDRFGVAPKTSTDAVIVDELEKEISDLGFLPLCDCHDTEYSAFYSNESAQKAKGYSDPSITRNARISKMLQYMFCSSRFAHYLKVLARDKLGSLYEPADLERYLQEWIAGYVTADTDADRDVKARYPLREALIEVRSHPGNPGSLLSSFKLLPHFELDELQAAVRLQTKFKTKN